MLRLECYMPVFKSFFVEYDHKMKNREVFKFPLIVIEIRSQ